MIPDLNHGQTPTAPDWTFEGNWPYDPHSFEHGGVRLHYVDEGTGAPVVMLHGNPTWGYVYRASSHSSRLVDTAGYFSREDEPERIVGIIQNFLGRYP